jgi:hypothetical protein
MLFSEFKDEIDIDAGLTLKPDTSAGVFTVVVPVTVTMYPFGSRVAFGGIRQLATTTPLSEAVVFSAKTVLGGVDPVAIFTVAGSARPYPVA